VCVLSLVYYVCVCEYTCMRQTYIWTMMMWLTRMCECVCFHMLIMFVWFVYVSICAPCQDDDDVVDENL
jgi:hypothetical protein